jgi:phage FluMu gp28-like protein
MLGLEGALMMLEGYSVYYVSRSEKQAIYLLDKFYRWCDILSDAGVIINFDKRSTTECKVNGVYVTSLTSNATTGEGFTGHVFFDEFGLLPNDREIYRSIYPTITRGYKLRIISRPFGQSNLFYDIYHDESAYPDFKRYSYDIYRAINDGNRVDIEQLRRGFDEDSFAENYECKFLDESTSYFPYNILRERIGTVPSDLSGGKYYIGIDVARKQHLTAMVILCKLKDFYYTVEVATLKRASFNEQKDKIRSLCEKYPVEAGSIDATGIGTQMAEEVNEEFPFIKGLMFSNKLKEQLVTGTKKLFENGNVQIPDDADLLSDFHRIRRNVTSSNNVVFDAIANSKSHADRFWAWSLAEFSGREDKQPNIIIL